MQYKSGLIAGFFLYTLEKTQGSRKNSGFCQFSSKLRSKTAILGSLYLIGLQKNSGSRQKNSGFWISCWSNDIHQGVQKKPDLLVLTHLCIIEATKNVPLFLSLAWELRILFRRKTQSSITDIQSFFMSSNIFTPLINRSKLRSYYY